MKFCTNCGHKIIEGVKYCTNCGTEILNSTYANQTETIESTEIYGNNTYFEIEKEVVEVTTTDTESVTETIVTETEEIVEESTTKISPQRKIGFDGEVHICPNCGEILKSFELVCPICGFKLRNASNSNSIKELQERLLKAKTEEQKITIIQIFPIPNTKEDIFEFMFLATSSFDASYYVTHLNENDISDAWLSKINQCYKKASYMFSNQEDLEKIKSMYDVVISNIEKHKIIDKKHSRKKRNKEKIQHFLNTPINGTQTPKSILFILAIIFIFIFVSIGALGCIGSTNSSNDNNTTETSIPIGHIRVTKSSSELIGQNYKEVTYMIQSMGFKNIEYAVIDGLIVKEGLVENVYINGNSSFKKGDHFHKYSKVLISYYTFKS